MTQAGVKIRKGGRIGPNIAFNVALCMMISFPGIGKISVLAANRVLFFIRPRPVNPNAAKVGGLQSRGVKGEAVVFLLQTLDNKESGALRLVPLAGAFPTCRAEL